MCVIAIAEEVRMTPEHVKRMFGSNRDGAGIGYREGGKVQWRKGLAEEEITDLVLTVPLPYVAHFRIASCGGVRPDLTHPFPIQKDVPLALKGSTTGNVLFHNGHLTRWKEYLLQLAIGSGKPLPKGKWSDSRTMAWIAAYCGLDILDQFDEKIVALGLSEIEIYGTGWSRVDDLIVSNRSWEFGGQMSHHYHGQGPVIYPGVCRFGKCKKDKVNGTAWCEEHPNGQERPIREVKESKGAEGVPPTPTNFRGGNGAVSTEENQQKAVEEVAKQFRGRDAAGQEEGEARLSLDKRMALINWVRKLNPKRVKSPTRHIEVQDAKDAEYGEALI